MILILAFIGNRFCDLKINLLYVQKPCIIENTDSTITKLPNYYQKSQFYIPMELKKTTASISAK